ncbi:TPA: alpha/beta hydrolase [Enterobacter asburiae]|nr:alpha/beta hydrolase [Enterobacter asburiae]HDR2861293.1 alpha/beta hydrolase [Enterobacter asburiae]
MIEQRLQQLSDRYTIILVPGLRDSDEYHWQSCWGRRFPFWKRIQQKDWLEPDLEKWVSAIRRELAISLLPAILVGHSFGALASCRLLQSRQENVAGIVMVAPAEPAYFGLEEAIQTSALPVPCILFASRNDPLMPFARAQFWATYWGGLLIDIGEAGHINSESGHGEWHYGLERLTEFCEQI